MAHIHKVMLAKGLSLALLQLMALNNHFVQEQNGLV